MPFKLEEWFDVSARISRADADDAEAQMMLYAYKSGDPVDSKEAKAAYKEMRDAVKQHNQQFNTPKTK